MSVSLNSFLDRLGLEDEGMRTCVWIVFMTDHDELPDEEVQRCLAWVVAVQELRMSLEEFHNNLRKFLMGPFLPGEIERVAQCMLSGHPPLDSDA